MTEKELQERVAEAKTLNNIDHSLQAQVDALVEFVLELKTGGLQQKASAPKATTGTH